mmetsp:Transcript_10722/g.22319  ORF Transcript_10722/g.22319 Transcript_10722/m.22319 type:complete len:270 (-) Transcript_10722:1005-1814(-)
MRTPSWVVVTDSRFWLMTEYSTTRKGRTYSSFDRKIIMFTDAEAPSNEYPLCSIFLMRCSSTLAADSLSENPASSACDSTLPLPDSSDTTACIVLPTSVGSMWLYECGSLRTAATCRPPLWAKALAPTKGSAAGGGWLHNSATAAAVGVSSLRFWGWIALYPIFTCRSPIMVRRLALPVRSPYPLTHACTSLAPARTATRELATARPVSLWQCTPMRTSGQSATASTARDVRSSTTQGMVPPLVSQSTTVDAPAAAAVRRHMSAYCSPR